MNQERADNGSIDSGNLVGQKRTFSEVSEVHQKSLVKRVATKVSDLIPSSISQWLKGNQLRDRKKKAARQSNSYETDTDSDGFDVTDQLSVNPPLKRTKYSSAVVDYANGGHSVAKATVSSEVNTSPNICLASSSNNSRIDANEAVRRPHHVVDSIQHASTSSGIITTNRSTASKYNLFDSYLRKKSEQKRKKDDSNRSIFNQSNQPNQPSNDVTQITRTRSPNAEPSFDSSVFGLSRIRSWANSTDEMHRSPYLKGMPTYGGASAHQPERANIPELGEDDDSFQTPKRFKISLNTSLNSSLKKNNTKSNLSNTAKQILSSLEQFATPIKWAHSTGEVLKSTYVEKSRSNQNKPYTRCDQDAKIGNRAKKSSLEVPIVSQFLQMKMKQHMQNSTENVRKIAISSNSKLNVEEYELPKANEDSATDGKFTLKIKNKITSRSRPSAATAPDPETERAPIPPNLPNVPLPITTLPQFDLLNSNRKAVGDRDNSAATATSSKSDQPFKFSSPNVLKDNDKPVVVNNFKFSTPKLVDVVLETTNSVKPKEVVGSRNNGMFSVDENKNWECESCLIKNVSNSGDICKICNVKRKQITAVAKNNQYVNNECNMFTCAVCGSKVFADNNTDNRCFRCQIKELKVNDATSVSATTNIPLVVSPKSILSPKSPLPTATKKTVTFIDDDMFVNTPKPPLGNSSLTVSPSEHNSMLSSTEEQRLPEAIVEPTTTGSGSGPGAGATPSVTCQFSMPLPTTISMDTTDMISKSNRSNNNNNNNESISENAEITSITFTPPKRIVTEAKQNPYLTTTLTTSAATATSSPTTTTSAFSPLVSSLTSVQSPEFKFNAPSFSSPPVSVPTVTKTSTVSSPAGDTPSFSFGTTTTTKTTASTTTSFPTLSPSAFSNVKVTRTPTTVTQSSSIFGSKTSSPSCLSAPAFSSGLSKSNDVTTAVTASTTTSPFSFTSNLTPMTSIGGNGNSVVDGNSKTTMSLQPASFSFGSKLFETSNKDLSSSSFSFGSTSKSSSQDVAGNFKSVFGSSNNSLLTTATTTPTSTMSAITTTAGFGSFTTTINSANAFAAVSTAVSSTAPTFSAFNSTSGFGNTQQSSSSPSSAFSFGSPTTTSATAVTASSFSINTTSAPVFGSTNNTSSYNFTPKKETPSSSDLFPFGGINSKSTVDNKTPAVFGSSISTGGDQTIGSTSMSPSSGFKFGFVGGGGGNSGAKSDSFQSNATPSSMFGNLSSSVPQSNTGLLFGNSNYSSTTGNNNMVNGGFNVAPAASTTNTNNVPSLYAFGSSPSTAQPSSSLFAFGSSNQTNGPTSTNFVFQTPVQTGQPQSSFDANVTAPIFNFTGTQASPSPSSGLVQQRRIAKAVRRTKPR